MAVSVGRVGAHEAVIRLEHGLDAQAGRAIEEMVDTLLHQRCRRVTVEMEAGGYIEYAGLEALVEAGQALRQAGGELRVNRLPAEAARLLRASNLESEFRAVVIEA